MGLGSIGEMNLGVRLQAELSSGYHTTEVEVRVRVRCAGHVLSRVLLRGLVLFLGLWQRDS